MSGQARYIKRDQCKKDELVVSIWGSVEIDSNVIIFMIDHPALKMGNFTSELPLAPR